MGENDGAKLPPDPIGALAEGAVQMHAIYEAYCTAGFTSEQAIYIVGQMIRASMNGGAPSND